MRCQLTLQARKTGGGSQLLLSACFLWTFCFPFTLLGHLVDFQHLQKNCITFLSQTSSRQLPLVFTCLPLISTEFPRWSFWQFFFPLFSELCVDIFKGDTNNWGPRDDLLHLVELTSSCLVNTIGYGMWPPKLERWSADMKDYAISSKWIGVVRNKKEFHSQPEWTWKCPTFDSRWYPECMLVRCWLEGSVKPTLDPQKNATIKSNVPI